MVLPVLLQNQGHGIATSLTFNIEFSSDEIDILDIRTEAMKVSAVFGSADQISPRLRSVVADPEIRKAYAGLGRSGTYIQLVGAFPAAAVEIFVIVFRAREELDTDVTLRMQTPQRVFQQKTVLQQLNIR